MNAHYAQASLVDDFPWRTADTRAAVARADEDWVAMDRDIQAVSLPA